MELFTLDIALIITIVYHFKLDRETPHVLTNRHRCHYRILTRKITGLILEHGSRNAKSGNEIAVLGCGGYHIVRK